MYTKEFISHARINEQNMRVAILGGLAFHDLRRELINEFAVDLKNTLEEKEWSDCEVSGWQNVGWVKLRKDNWLPHVYVGICPSTDFAKHELGAIAYNKEVDNQTRINISNRLKNEIGNSPLDPYCAWRKRFGTNYENLNSEDGLMALSEYKRADTLTDLVKKIEAVGNVLDSIFPTKVQ